MHQIGPITWKDGSRYGQEIAARQDDMLDDIALAYAKELAAQAAPAKRRPVVYDLGGASGYMAARFAERGCDVYVVDMGEFAYDITRRQRWLKEEGFKGTITFVQADAYKLDDLALPPADIIYSSCLAHFAPPEKNLDLFLSVRRALKPHGRFYMRLSGGSEDIYPRYFARAAKRRFRTPFFITPSRYWHNVPSMEYSRPELYSLFFATGFSEINVRRVYKDIFYYAIGFGVRPPLRLTAAPKAARDAAPG